MRGNQRESEVHNLAEYIAETVFEIKKKFRKKVIFCCLFLMSFHEKIFLQELTRFGRNATILYLSTKMFYVLNIIGQLYMMNHFLGGDYFKWGYQVWFNIACDCHIFFIRAEHYTALLVTSDRGDRLIGLWKILNEYFIASRFNIPIQFRAVDYDRKKICVEGRKKFLGILVGALIYPATPCHAIQ